MSVEKPKVAFLAGTLSLGGAEKQMYLMVKCLLDHNVNVIVLTFTSGEYYENQLRQLEVPCITISGNRINRLLKLYKQLRIWKPTILHSVQGFVSPYAGLLGRLLGIKSIGTIRSSIEYFDQHHSKILLRLICRLPHLVVINSKSAYDQVIREKLLTKVKAKLLLNVIPSQKAPMLRLREKLVFLYIGKLNYDKGIYDLISAFELLGDEDIDRISELLIIGDGPEKRVFLEKVEKLSMDRNLKVKFLGNQENSKIPSLLKEADILLFTSHCEGFPNVILEGMVAGLTVIATNVGDVPNIIDDGNDGFIVPPKSPEQIAAKIKGLFLYPNKIGSIGQSAFKKVSDDYNFDSLYNNLMSIYSL